MNLNEINGPDYSQPILIAPDTWWVGFFDQDLGLHCNPYLIVEGEEAVLIDGGSRPDFPSVMMKILQTGLEPNQIKALIYQHYDPDLVGGVSSFESLINRSDLQIISHRANHMFIRHYAISSPLVGLEQMGHVFRFSSGRELRFVETPYSHSAGSFVTYDPQTRALFTSDLLGSYGKKWDLFLRLDAACRGCASLEACPQGHGYCPLRDMVGFHRHIMTSGRALRLAISRLARLPFRLAAPQHGSVIAQAEDLQAVLERLFTLEGVGIDGVDGDGEDRGLDRLREERRCSLAGG